MNLVFTLRDLLFFLLICFILFASVFLIKIFINLGKFLKNLNKIAEENKENIKNTVAMLPDVTKNVNKAAIGLNENLERIDSLLGSVDDVVNDTRSAFSGGASSLSNYLAAAGAGLNAIMKIIDAGKQPEI